MIDTLTVLGNFNARIGKESFVKPVAGKYLLHDETSPNRLKLAENLSLKILSTAFQHKNIHKDTWRMPSREIINYIDHVLLVNRRRGSSVLDVRVCRDANYDSDYYFVKIRQKYLTPQ